MPFHVLIRNVSFIVGDVGLLRLTCGEGGPKGGRAVVFEMFFDSLHFCTFALLHFFELWLMFSFLVLVNDRVI